MTNLITLISLALTPLTILASAAVIYYLYKPFMKALSEKDRSAVQWMILGIVIGFAGTAFDNIWWGIAWSSKYIDSPAMPFFFDNGVYSNVVARQLMGIIAGLCHVASAVMVRDRAVKKLIYTGCILGTLLVLNLIYLRL